MVDAVLAGDGLERVAELAADAVGGSVAIIVPRLGTAVMAPAGTPAAERLPELRRYVADLVQDPLRTVHEIYERLGAHPRQIDGADGVGFAVWAPSALGVSVVGDFNSWDGRLHPMRALGSSGIWELFVPGVPDGTPYKYEIHTPAGDLRLKADPYAAQAQEAPGTDSVVHRPAHAWQDAEWMAARQASTEATAWSRVKRMASTGVRTQVASA